MDKRKKSEVAEYFAGEQVRKGDVVIHKGKDKTGKMRIFYEKQVG